MAERCAWLIGVGDADAAAQLAASQLRGYGVNLKGQKWPVGEKQAWLASAQEAAGAGARLILIVATPEDYQKPELRRELALFRLFLQTLMKSPVDGLVILTDPSKAAEIQTDLPGTPLLGDFEIVQGAGWQAKAVARLHAPRKPKWPVRFGLYAQEKLGVWLEVKPQPLETTTGCLVGVGGNESNISFHAVGEAGRLPEKSINEYEMKGIEFESAGQKFKAWALQNTFTPEDAYYVRLEGEPDVLAIGTLPDGEVSDVDLFCLR
ncbi:hypothetical protein [Orrella daihaiensis]|uniref:TIR domain-containing protein n=1 Tax=Orrella daihaiensis TaxID=2782176 RepID=A0ABY4ALW3_9BURK|nr:hypothetical protein [Orrella daihaiensis]UOD50080.1 hypothetical protein DHf2319_11660 [Orrella daihaiensis]